MLKPSVPLQAVGLHRTVSRGRGTIGRFHPKVAEARNPRDQRRSELFECATATRRHRTGRHGLRAAAAASKALRPLRSHRHSPLRTASHAQPAAHF